MIIFSVFDKLCKVNNQNCDIVQGASIESFSGEHFSSQIRVFLNSEKSDQVNASCQCQPPWPRTLPGSNDCDSVLIGVSVPEAVGGQDGKLHSVIQNIEGQNVGITNYDLLFLK